MPRIGLQYLGNPFRAHIIASRPFAKFRAYSSIGKINSPVVNQKEERDRPAKGIPGMDQEEFRKAAHGAIEDIINYFTTLPTLPVTPLIKPGYLRPQLPHSAPLTPEPFSAISADIPRLIAPGLTHWQHPNFMAFFPATVTYPSILGEMYSAAFNAPAFNWLCSPACTELETVVLDWVAGMLGLPEVFLSEGGNGGGGVIQGSASEAVVTVMVAAREKRVREVLEKEGLGEVEGESEDRRCRREDRAAEIKGKLVALGSEQSHSSTQKAANILGVRYRNVTAGRTSRYRMTGKNLRAKLEECKKLGLEPFYLTATLGTTGTCAVDEFDEIAEVKKEWPRLWVHVDAAYAGAALICKEYRELAKAKWLGEFDSFDMNMHKWLLVNFDASCLFVRNRLDLTRALSITPSYLVNPAAITGLVTDYRDWQIPLGRRFRALKIWFVIRSYGVEGLQAMIRKHVALGEVFGGLVRGRGDLFEVVDGPRFALTVLRCRMPGEMRGSGRREEESAVGVGEESEMNGFRTKRETQDMTAANALTKEVYELVNGRGEVFLTSTILDGVYSIRVVSANERAEEKFLTRAFEILVEATEEVLAKRTNGFANGHA